MSEPKTAVVISGPEKYSAAKGAKKSGESTAIVLGSLLVGGLIAAFSDPTLQAQIGAALADRPWAPAVPLVLHFGVTMLRNWLKNREPVAVIEAATVEASPVAAAVAVQGQLDRNESPAPAVVLTEKQPPNRG